MSPCISCHVNCSRAIGDSSAILSGGEPATLQVENGAIVAAGAVVQPGTVVPSGELWAGNPARKLRAVKPEESQYLSTVASAYVSPAMCGIVKGGAAGALSAGSSLLCTCAVELVHAIDKPAWHLVVQVDLGKKHIAATPKDLNDLAKAAGEQLKA